MDMRAGRSAASASPPRPSGATNQTDLDLLQAARALPRLLRAGRPMGVVPQVRGVGLFEDAEPARRGAAGRHRERPPARPASWPTSTTSTRAAPASHGLRLLGGTRMHVLHMNDYPADAAARHDHRRPAASTPATAWPRWCRLLRDLRDLGFRGMLSLELFNRDYWKQDALGVARTGLEKMRWLVRSSV